MPETRRTMLIRNVHGEGWYVTLLYDGEIIVTCGPTKTKPGPRRLRSLQYRHFQGHTYDLVKGEEETIR